jgi:hypothetical protein
MRAKSKDVQKRIDDLTKALELMVQCPRKASSINRAKKLLETGLNIYNVEVTGTIIAKATLPVTAANKAEAQVKVREHFKMIKGWEVAPGVKVDGQIVDKVAIVRVS